jgi:hypothetical protein
MGIRESISNQQLEKLIYISKVGWSANLDVKIIKRAKPLLISTFRLLGR